MAKLLERMVLRRVDHYLESTGYFPGRQTGGPRGKNPQLHRGLPAGPHPHGPRRGRAQLAKTGDKGCSAGRRYQPTPLQPRNGGDRGSHRPRPTPQPPHPPRYRVSHPEATTCGGAVAADPVRS
ncbi:unnamed protein product [Ixodes persulcatus]